MIYMKILKKGGSREKGGGGSEIHAPCACGYNLITGYLTVHAPAPSFFVVAISLILARVIF
jgi:hypothetical protein